MSQETIDVAEVSDGVGGTAGEPGDPVELPVVEVLTGRAFVTGKSGSGKSILEGTPVHTERGRKPIEDVEPGEKVLSLNKNSYKQEFRDVLGVVEHESDALLEITLEDGTTLVGTEDHSFLTVRNMEIVPIRGENVTEGTWLPLSRELPSAETVTEIDLREYVTPSKDIDVRDEEIRSGSKTDSRFLELDFDTGKVVGLYLAEGSFDSRLTVQISNIDEGVREFLGSQGFKVYERTCNRAFKPFGEFVESEFGRGSGEKSLPDWLHDAPKEFKAGVISGYFDGDGTVGDNDVTMMSKSTELVAGLSELLRSIGISSTIRDKMVLYDGEQRQFKRLTIDAFCVSRFADFVSLSVTEKSDRLTELVQDLERGDSYNSKDMIPNFGEVLNISARERNWTKRESENRTKGASVHHLTRKQKVGRETYNRLLNELDVEGRAKQFGKSDIQWKRVVSVEELEGERTVYDLDVELNDNFVANGVFVHNSNTMSVVAEKLLDGGYPVMIVDTDGEYYGLKEEYELLHAGADDECDIQVEPQHAEKLASLALEDNVPIILDVSGYLDEDDGKELLKAVAQQLFAKEKKLKKPFLMVVEEVHEYIPEGAGMGECGRMLIKIGKRGRKHGLGIAGISQRPADVKKDFITQCDWLVWHRLTWNNDTNVVGRILGNEYADEIEDMGDGEAFLTTDWSEETRRVQFHRKQTFDAGATPGLDDFERPDLKSVSDDLVSDLREITEAEQRQEDRIEELQQELQQREERITDLERQLEEAREMEEVADTFAKAMLDTSRNRRANPYVDTGGGQAPQHPRQADLGGFEQDDAEGAATDDSTTDEAGSEDDGSTTNAERDPLDAIHAELDALDPVERGMLAHYLREGPATPVEAHAVAGGGDDRELAYSHNRTLRQRGFVQHAGGGEYVAALPSLLAALTDGEMDDDRRTEALAEVAEELPDVESA